MGKLLPTLIVWLAIVSLALSACTSTPATPTASVATKAPSASTAAPAASPAAKGAATAPAAAQPVDKGGAATTDAWQKIVDAAKKEGKVVYYGAQGLEPALDAAAATLKKDYGIELQYSVERGSGGREKVLAEVRSGKIIADAMGSGLGDMVILKQENALAKVPDLPNLSLVSRELWDPDSMYVPIYANTYGILINTSQVKPADEPKGWQDLLDPKWKGKMISDDPRNVGGGNMFFGLSVRKFGQDYQVKLAQQDVHFTRDYQENEKAVARGEFPVYYPAILLGAYTRLEGAPVKLIVPQEGIGYVSITAGPVKGAPHPNAALVLLNWFLSPEGQREFTKTGRAGVRGDIDLGVAKEAVPFLVGNAKLLGTYTEDELTNPDAVVKNVESIYGKY